jgi:hypothetical protein
VDAHGYGKRFIVHGEEILTAFAELERAIHGFAVILMLYNKPFSVIAVRVSNPHCASLRVQR